MANRPSLDEIFAEDEAPKRPSLDEIFADEPAESKRPSLDEIFSDDADLPEDVQRPSVDIDANRFLKSPLLTGLSEMAIGPMGVTGDEKVSKKTARGYKLGQFVVERGKLGAEAMYGRLDDAQATERAKALESSLPEEGISEKFRWSSPKSIAEAMAGGTAELLPFMAESMFEGVKIGVKASAAGAVAGNVIPGLGALAGAATGFKAGSIIGSIKTSAEIEGGNLYLDLTKDGVSPEIARPVAVGTGIGIGILEAAGIGIILKRIPGLKRAFFNKVSDTVIKNPNIRQALVKLSVNVAKDFAAETGIEITQELASVGGEILAKTLEEAKSDKELNKPGLKDVFKRLEQVAVMSAQGFPLLILPGNAMSFAKELKPAKQAKAAEQEKEFTPAPDQPSAKQTDGPDGPEPTEQTAASQKGQETPEEGEIRRVAGVEMKAAEVTTEEGIDYELWEGKNKSAIRIKDKDSGYVVSLQVFPKFEQAKEKFEKEAPKKAKKEKTQAQKEEDFAKIVRKGGGIYKGYQKPVKSKSGKEYGEMVYFDNAAGSTLVLNPADLTPENVAKKVKESNEKFLLGAQITPEEIEGIFFQEEGDTPAVSILKAIKEEINRGDPGGRIFDEEKGRYVDGYSSTYPDYFKNKDYEKAKIIPILDKWIAGEKITPKEFLTVQDLTNGIIEQRRKEAARYEEEAGKLEEEASRIEEESRAAEGEGDQSEEASGRSGKVQEQDAPGRSAADELDPSEDTSFDFGENEKPKKSAEKAKTVKTITGREIPAPPVIRTDTNRKATKDLKAQNQWLIDQAIAEATARKDDFNLAQFKNEKADNLPPASKDAMSLYLFDDTYAEFDAQTGEQIKESASTSEDGKPKVQTQTPEFKKWFGDSKIVDENGKPLVVYHGSPVKGFAEFKKEKINKSDPDGPFNGFFFSSSFDDAKSSGDFPWGRPNTEGGGETRPFYLSITNPATRQQANDVASEIESVWEEKHKDARSLQDAVRMELQERGFDGIIMEPYVSASKEAFEKNGKIDLGKKGYTLRKDEEYGGVSLYSGNEHITGYSDFEDAMSFLKHGTFIAFEPEQIKPAEETSPAEEFSLESEKAPEPKKEAEPDMFGGEKSFRKPEFGENKTLKSQEESALPLQEAANEEKQAKIETPPPAADPFEAHTEFVKKLNAGEITAAELKERFQKVLEMEYEIKAKLAEKTVKELVNGKARSGTTKKEIVDSIYSQMTRRYHVGDSYGYNPMQESAMDALKREVAKTTDEDIQKYAADRKERLSGLKKSLEDPETAEEFRTFIDYKGEKALTAEQKIRWDEIQAEAQKKRQGYEQERKATVQGVKLEDADFTLTEEKHSKTGEALFVVKLSKRIDGDTFKTLAGKARVFSGGWSRYSGGFLFRDKSNAEKFMQLKEGNVSRIEDVKAKKEEVKDNAVTRLRTMAEELEASGDERLNQDRKMNTAKRLREGESAMQQAEADKALAKTMRNVADAIERGEAKHLEGIRTKAQVQQLQTILRSAQYRSAQLRANKGGNISQYMERPPALEDIESAQFPFPSIHKDNLMSLAAEMENRKGYIRFARDVIKHLRSIRSEDYRVVLSESSPIKSSVKELAQGAKSLGVRKYEAENILEEFREEGRMRTMGIETLPQLRAALREFLTVRTEAAKPDALKMEEAKIKLQQGGDFFTTPRELAKNLVDAADIDPNKNMDILEPSAGTGSIAEIIHEQFPEHNLVLNEINPAKAEFLRKKKIGSEVFNKDFLEINNRYDRIVMNPPFSAEIEHVRHAFDILRPGGKLVSVMSSGPFFRGFAADREFREWFESNGGERVDNPEGSFKDSGTGVNTVTITMEKPEADGMEKGVKANQEVLLESSKEESDDIQEYNPKKWPADPTLGKTATMQNAPARTQKPAGTIKSTNAPQVIDALAKVAEAMGSIVPIRTGKVPKKYLGAFKVRPEVIRIKTANDITTAAHEVGHALEKAVYGFPHGGPWKNPLVDRTMQKELYKLGQDLYGSQQPAGGYKREGFAEFIRLWVTERASASQRAPVFSRWFQDEFLKKNEAVEKPLEKASRLSRDFYEQGAVQRAKASVVDKGSLSQKYQMAKDALKGAFSFRTHIEMLEPIYRLSKVASEKIGRNLKPSEDPAFTAAALRLTHDARTRYMIEDAMIDVAGNKVGAPLSDITALVKGKQEDFTIYLWAKRALALLDDPRGPRNPGLMREDALHIIQELDSPKFQMAAQKVYDWNDGVLNYAAQASPSFAAVVEKIRAVDPGYYLPLSREFRSIEQIWAHSAVRSSAKGGSISARLKGSGRRIVDPFPVMISNARNVVKAAHERLVLDQIMNLSQSVEGLGFLVEEISPDRVPVATRTIRDLIDQIDKHLKENGGSLSVDGDVDIVGESITFFSQAQNPKSGLPILPIWDNGKVRWFQLDPDIYKALSGMDVYRLPQIAGLPIMDLLFGMPARLFRTGTTGLRASFGLIANPIRDIQTFYLNAQSTANPATLLTAWFKSLSDGIWRQATGKKNPYLDAFVRLGGEMAQPLGQDIDHTRRAARRLFQGKVIKTLDPRNIFDSFRDIIQVPESAPRVGELRELAKKIGWKPGEQITLDQSLQLLLASKQVTTDFTAAGELSRFLNQMIPFYNAAIQGPRASIRAYLRADTPGKRMAWLMRGVAMLTLPTIALWWEHKDEEWYKEMPYKEKFLNWFFPVNLFGEETLVKIPRAFEIGQVFASLPEALLDSAYRRNPEAVKVWFSAFSDIANPLSWPVLLRVMREQDQNKDFFWNSPIVPRIMENLPEEEQFTEFTSESAKLMGRIFNVSPIRVEHAINGVAGRVPLDAVKTTEDVLSELGVIPKGLKKDIEAADWFVIGRLFRRGGPMGSNQKSVSEFYDALEESKMKAASHRYEESDEDKMLGKILRDAQAAISAQSMAMKNMTSSEDLRASRLSILRIAQRAVAAYKNRDISLIDEYSEKGSAARKEKEEQKEKYLKRLHGNAS